MARETHVSSAKHCHAEDLVGGRPRFAQQKYRNSAVAGDNAKVLDLPSNMPAETLRMLHQLVEALENTANVVAVVLGGSHARGFARPDSDIDIGIYYREAAPFSAEQMRSTAAAVSTPGSAPIVTGMYEWGPWVNGGAWIQTPVGDVDLIYRNLDQVESVIEEGRRGIWRHDYDQQPPFGFRSVVYCGETSCCVPLHDPKGEIARLKDLVARYPEPLKDRIVQDSLWNAEFSLWFCGNFIDPPDVLNAAASFVRVAHFLVQALFALNEEYFVSDKYANRLLEHFAARPRDFTSRLASVLSCPGAGAALLRRSLESMRTLWRETVELTAGKYEPRYHL